MFFTSYCNLLRHMSHLSTVAVVFDFKRCLLTLFPVLPKPEVGFNSQMVEDRYRTVVQAVVKANGQSNWNGKIWTPRGSKNHERISMKLGIYTVSTEKRRPPSMF